MGGVGGADALADGIDADQFAMQAADPHCQIETEAEAFLAGLSDRAGVDTQAQGEGGGRPAGTRAEPVRPGAPGSPRRGSRDTEYGVGGCTSDVPGHLALIRDAEHAADLGH
ncbi:hypothetical protein [Streptomyces sp. NPDC059349]|uniref:hypothetical protein n=1 Tax=Streptomyces sp. NPDC059349 TaxID=3346808 RepID=UPI0036748523